MKRDGADGVLSELTNSIDVISAHYTQFTSENSDDYLNINNFIEVCIDEIARMDNSVIRELLAKRLSELTKVSTDAILEPLNQKINKRKSYQHNVQSNKTKQSEVVNNNFSQKLYDDLIMLCCCKDQDIRKFIFENLNIEWMQSDLHRKIYDSIYIHLNSEFEPPIDVVSENIEDYKAKNKFIEIIFDINKFDSTLNMAKDCVRRIEIEHVNINIEKLRLEIKNNPEDISLIKKLSDFEKEISNIKNKYNE